MKKIFPKVNIKIQYEDFDISQETKKLHDNRTGAIVSFVGLVRSHNENNNEQINAMTLEHYSGMTEAEIDKIIQKSIKKWDLTGITVIHRVGKLFVSDQIVFVGVSSMHRQNSFDACNFIMDWLKTKAPFWKVEENNNQRNWVAFRKSDREATKKWEN
jgi:molybdopterin synthase catalytic subunit